MPSGNELLIQGKFAANISVNHLSNKCFEEEICSLEKIHEDPDTYLLTCTLHISGLKMWDKRSKVQN